MRMTKRIFKITFIITMFVLNLVYVAIPLIQKYLADGIMMEISTFSPETLIAPAITFISILGSYEDQGYFVVHWTPFNALSDRHYNHFWTTTHPPQNF